MFASLKNAFLKFASNFLRQIAQMIAVQIAFNAVSGAGSGGSGGGAAAPQDVKIVNLYDPAQMVSQMLGTRAGVKAILNVVSDNPAAFKAAIG